MRVFICGDYSNPGGPATVNRGLKSELTQEYCFLEKKRTVDKLFEVVKKTIQSDIIVFSGIIKLAFPALVLTKLLKKKIAYIMHGYLQYEDKINNRENTFGELLERKIIKSADEIYCVSNPFAVFVRERIPEKEKHIKVLTNGIDWKYLDAMSASASEEHRGCSIAVAGGARETKKNFNVCCAVDRINREENIKIKLNIYGVVDEEFRSKCKDLDFIEYRGILPKKEYLEQISRTRLFVSNSSFETFGLAPVEALVLGCDVLLSKDTGVISVMDNLTENDTIFDCESVDEIAEKIKIVLSSRNHARILSGIDREKTGNDYRAAEFDGYMRVLYKRSEKV